MRKEIVEAAKQGVLKLIAECPMHGAKLIDTPRGFVVVQENGDRLYFDTLEL